MGQTTANIGIYVPSAGETNYDAAFLAGMLNIDQHDHSGGPNKGVPLSTSGLADGSVTFPKLNANVADTSTGIGVSGANPNQLVMLGLLASIYQNATATGFLGKNGTTAFARTITSGTTNRLTVANGDGVSGDPTLSVPAVPDYDGINNSAGTLNLQVGGVTQATLTSALLNLSPNNTAVRTGTFNTPGIAPAGTEPITGFVIPVNSTYLVLANTLAGGGPFTQIAIVGEGDAPLGSNPGTGNTIGGASPTFSVSAGQVSLTNNAPGALSFQVSWIKLL